MHCDLHTVVTICAQSVMIQSLSLHRQSAQLAKEYYQHRHPGFELHYVSEGKSRVTCENAAFTLDAGMALIVPPGAYHDLADVEKDTSRLSISFDIHKPDASKEKNKGKIFAQAFCRAEPVFADLQDTEAREILQKIERMLSGSMDGPYSRDKLLVLCSGLLLEIADIVTAEQTQQLRETVADIPDVAFRIDGFLGRNFMCNNAMPRMAEKLHISTRQLHRMIRKNYDTNYRQKLCETRIKIAMDMLSNTTMPIYRIGEILGYSSSSNFSLFVKRHTGKTPSQIRKDSK